MTRRDALIGALALPAAGLLDKPDLRTAARLGGRRFGAAAQFEQIRRDPAFRDAMLSQCDVFTPELALKWAAVQPTPNQFDFKAMDHLAGFVRDHQRSIHGHTLIWHRSVPTWAGEALATGDWNVVRRYMEVVMRRYANQVQYWDVINEPIEPLDDADGLRRGPFLSGIGPGYIRRALEDARLIAPKASLLINEYGLEYPIPDEESRRGRLLRLIDDLLRDGAPLNGVGIQAHLRVDGPVIDQLVLSSFLQALADRGLLVLITELDFREADYSLSISQRDRQVADTARAFLDVVLDQPAVIGVTTWGLSDRYSWLNHDDEVGVKAPGGNRGLPLDNAMQRKPLHNELVDAFRKGRAASPSPPTVATLPKGS